MLRLRSSRRQGQTAAESTDEKNGAWSSGSGHDDADGGSSISVASGTDDSNYLLGSNGGCRPKQFPSPSPYKRSPSYTFNKHWRDGRKSLSTSSITIQELRQKSSPRGGATRGGRLLGCCCRKNFGAYFYPTMSVILFLSLVSDADRCRRGTYDMERELDVIVPGRDGGRDRDDPLRVLMKGTRASFDSVARYIGEFIVDVRVRLDGGNSFGEISAVVGDGSSRDDVVEDTAEIGDPQEDGRLHSQRQALMQEVTMWEEKQQKTRNDIAALQSQIDKIHLQEETLRSLQSQLEDENRMAKELKDKFLLTHELYSKAVANRTLGPGHSVLQRRELQKMDSLEDYEKYIEDREQALWKKIDNLIAMVKKDSRREAIEWFGFGPHSVLIEIEYPEYAEDVAAEHWPRKRGFLRLEMASLDLMPVSVNLFLQQVHHGLFDNANFAANLPHILQVESADLRRFQELKLDVVPFQEYHKDFPHEKLTLGFVGRPGGPNFYINKQNNTDYHGPGGQTQHELHEEADPCFAKVVEGHDILENIYRIPTTVTGSVLMHPVTIINAKLISLRENNAPQQSQPTHAEGSQKQEQPSISIDGESKK